MLKSPRSTLRLCSNICQNKWREEKSKKSGFLVSHILFDHHTYTSFMVHVVDLHSRPRARLKLLLDFFFCEFLIFFFFFSPVWDVASSTFAEPKKSRKKSFHDGIWIWNHNNTTELTTGLHFSCCCFYIYVSLTRFLRWLDIAVMCAHIEKSNPSSKLKSQRRFRQSLFFSFFSPFTETETRFQRKSAARKAI